MIRGSYDSYKDFRMDNCYVLIKVYHDTHEIGLAVCSNEHIILKEFRGRIAQEIYVPLMYYIQKNNTHWFERYDHWAYIGKELKKAEIALGLSIEYIQE